MSYLRNLSFRIRISLVSTLGLLAAFSVMGWLGWQISNATNQMIMQERLNLARAVALHVDQDLERTFSRLAQVATFPTLDLEDGDLEPEKAELRALYRPEVFSYVFILDKESRVLWTEPYLPDAVDAFFPECLHVQDVLQTGQPSIASVAHALTPQNPVVTALMPLRNQDGSVAGILGAAVDPTSPVFTRMLMEMAQGNSAYVQLVDENGITLAHTQDKGLFQRSAHTDLFVQLLRENKPDIASHVINEEGKGAFREVIAFAPLSITPWGVAVEQSETDFLAPVLDARRKMEISAAIILIVVLLVTWVSTGNVVEPVRKLAAAAQRITAGDLTTTVPQYGQDELGALARHFETMREHLARWGEELETAVQKRTRDLSVLYSIDRATAQSLNLKEILPDALDGVLNALQIEAGGLYLLEPDGKTMILRVQRGFSAEFARNVECIQLGEGISGRAAAEKRPVVLDVSDYPTERLAPFLIQENLQTLASAPLLSAGELVGALNLATRHSRTFPTEELELMTSIGQQLGSAIYNTRLYQETQERAARLSLLNHIAHALSATLDLDALLEIVYHEITDVIDADAFFIALYDQVTGELDFRIRVDEGKREPPMRQPLAPGITAQVIQDKRSLLIHDFEQEKDRLPPASLWGSMQAPRSWLGAPLLLGDTVEGVISVQAYRANAYGEAERELLDTIADAVVVAIENARLYEAERRRAARLDALQRLGAELATLRTESAVLTALVAGAAALAGSPTCTVMLINEETDEAILAAQVGLPEGTSVGLRVPLAVPIIRRSLETGEPIILTDIDRDAPQMRTVLVHREIRAFFAYPVAREGRAIGFITLSSLTPRTPSAEEITAYRLLAERAAVALENVRLYTALQAELAERERAEQQIQERVHELERFNRLAVGRELKMAELKERIRQLDAGEEGSS